MREVCEGCASKATDMGWSLHDLEVKHKVVEKNDWSTRRCALWHPSNPLCREFPVVLVPCLCAKRVRYRDRYPEEAGFYIAGDGMIPN